MYNKQEGFLKQLKRVTVWFTGQSYRVTGRLLHTELNVLLPPTHPLWAEADRLTSQPALVLCEAFPSKSPLLKCLMLMCIILLDTYFHASLVWLHNLYFDCQLTCHQILFPAMEFVILISLCVSFTPSYWHKHAHTPKGTIPTAGVNYDIYVCVVSQMCVWMWERTDCMNQDFLDFSFNSSAMWGKPASGGSQL